MKWRLWIIGLILFTGCKKTDFYFTEDLHIESYEDIEKIKLYGEKIVDDEIGFIDLEIVGNYLLCSVEKSSNKFNLYSKEGKKLSEFGHHGDGPNDFINTRFAGNKEIDSLGNAFVWINDVSAARLKQIKISATDDSISCKMVKSIPTLPMSANSFYVNDSLVLSEVLEDGTYFLWSFNPQTKRIDNDIKLYHEKVKHPFSFYKGKSRFDRDNNSFIIAMHSINQINILDLGGEKRSSCLVGKPTIKDKVIDPEQGMENMTYYSDLRIGKQRSYALYLNQKYDDAYEVPAPIEIHVIKNKLIEKIYTIDEHIIHFAVDETENCIFGLCADDVVYKYNIIH